MTSTPHMATRWRRAALAVLLAASLAGATAAGAADAGAAPTDQTGADNPVATVAADTPTTHGQTANPEPRGIEQAQIPTSPSSQLDSPPQTFVSYPQTLIAQLLRLLDALTSSISCPRPAPAPASSAAPSTTPSATAPPPATPAATDCSNPTAPCQWSLSVTGQSQGTWRAPVDEGYITFTAPATGLWTFVSSGLPAAGDLDVIVYDSQSRRVTSDDDSGADWNFLATPWLIAGGTYRLVVANWRDEVDPYSYTITATAPTSQQCAPWTLDPTGAPLTADLKSLGDVRCWIVTPTASGIWTIAVGPLPYNVHLQAELLDAQGVRLAWRANTATSATAFSMAKPLAAGTTYVFWIRHLHVDSGVLAQSFTLSAALPA